jgi:hypothetical protein
MKVLGINRAEILVKDPDAAVETFTRLFNGATFTPDHGVSGRPLVCRHDWEHGLEIVSPQDETDMVGQVMKEHGEGAVLTVVYEVESLADAKAYLVKNGFEIQYEGNYDHHPDVEVYRQIVVKPKDTHGFRVTFMERRLKGA